MVSRKPVDVTKLSHKEAIDYFYKRGVGLEYFSRLNVGTEGLPLGEVEHFAKALDGHRSMLHTDTRSGQDLANDIASYLRVLGYTSTAVQPTATQANWAHRVRRGRSVGSWQERTRFRLVEWWYNLRHKRK